MTKLRVLFVCAGNICRSPMAEGVFQHMVREAGLEDHIETDSAGTGSWHVGELAHQGTRAILEKNSIPYEGRSRQLKRSDIDDFDYVLAMDAANMDGVMHYAKEAENARNSMFFRTGKRHEVSMFLHYANEAGTVNETSVPDPYYVGNFEEVYDLVYKGNQALLTYIRKQHDL